MAKQRENSNVVDLIEPAPEGLNISREDWARTPPEIRSETIRMYRELSERIPIEKDRRSGRTHRGKRVKGGFWELHCCERDATPESLARAAELREILAPEIARIAEIESLEPFHEMAKANGKTLADVLRQYMAVEQRLRMDPHGEMTQIIANLGIDPTDYATVIAAGVHLAHGDFLPMAVQAIRRNPHRSWEGVHFGFMAQDVQKVRPDCVAMQPNGYLAVDYGRLLKTPEARSLPLYTFRYIDGVQFLDPPQFQPDEVA